MFMPVWRGISATVRGIGSTIDAIGASLMGNLAHRENLMPAINRLAFQGTKPKYGDFTFVAPNAAVIGDVTIGPRSSVWYGATLRGDVNAITIGHTTNIQDRCVVHVARHNPNGDSLPTTIGDRVTVGHGAILHACTIEDESLIGMGAKVLDGAVVRKRAIVAAGSLVAPGTEVPSGQVWAGCPARFLRELEPAEEEFLSSSAQNYAELAMQHWDENTKVWLTHLYDDQKAYDLENRDPNSDEELGIRRDPFTREILPPLQTDRPDTPGSDQQPYNVGASATTARLESRSKDVPRAEEKSG